MTNKSCLDSQALYDCNTRFMINTKDSVEVQEACEKACPTECDRIEFVYSISGNEVNFCSVKRMHI